MSVASTPICKLSKFEYGFMDIFPPLVGSLSNTPLAHSKRMTS